MLKFLLGKILYIITIFSSLSVLLMFFFLTHFFFQNIQMIFSNLSIIAPSASVAAGVTVSANGLGPDPTVATVRFHFVH